MSSLSRNLSKLLQFLWVKVRQNLNFSKFQNLEILLNFGDFCPIYLHVSSIYKYLQLMYSNLGPKTTPSFISRGGRNRYPLGNRVKGMMKNSPVQIVLIGTVIFTYTDDFLWNAILTSDYNSENKSCMVRNYIKIDTQDQKPLWIC